MERTISFIVIVGIGKLFFLYGTDFVAIITGNSPHLFQVFFIDYDVVFCPFAMMDFFNVHAYIGLGK